MQVQDDNSPIHTVPGDSTVRQHVIGLLAFAVISASFIDRSQAGDNPIYRASRDYREAVRAFEQVVLRTPRIRSSVERLVDDLEDASARLKLATADPGRFDRLQMRFVATDKLHTRVEMMFFGDPLFPAAPHLEAAWFPVSQTYAVLVNELQYLHQLRSAKRGNALPLVDHDPVPLNGGPTTRSSPHYRYHVPRSSSREPDLYSPTAGGDAGLTRRVITTEDGLRRAVIGAMLQRR